ncbi:MAG: nucleotidyltransferase [Gammaproteobacteria bacterium]|nr:nucleotidyltransferase [Gammaproteobacteria bacterium]
MLNEDYRDMLRDLVDEKVSFLVIGSYAMAAHGYLRATVDIDIWVMPSPDNAEAVLRAVKRFGAPLDNLTPTDLQKEDTVFQIGVAPRRIDILTGVTGLRFEESFRRSIEVDIDGIPVRIPSLDDLIRNKKASSRTRDLADVEALQALRKLK